MELTQLIYFRTVANSGSVTRAAEELFITQSALSRTIQRLETEIGGKLFERDKGRFYLNENGRMFLAHVQVALGELEQGVQAVMQNEKRKSIRVYNFLLPGFLDGIFDLCQANHPALSLELEDSANQDGMEHFEAYAPDIVLSPIGEYRNYICQASFSESWCLLHHNNYRSLEHQPLRPSMTCRQAVREPMVFHGSEYDKTFLVNTFTASSFQPAVLYTQNSKDFCRIVYQGKYLGVTSVWFARRILKQNPKLPISQASLSDADFTRQIHLCCKRGFPDTAEETDILSALISHISEELSLD